MRTVEVKVYKVKELPKDLLEKVLEKHRYWNVEDEWWCEFTIDDWKGKLKEFGFSNAEIHYSGFCSQGDGACFDADIDTSIAASVLKYNEMELKALEIADPHYSITKNSYANHYSHYNTRDVAFQECYNISGRALDEFEKVMNTPALELPTLIGSLEEPEAQSFLEARIQSGLDIRQDLFKALETDLEEKREEFSRQIYRDLETEYEYQTSDECIIESLEANDAEFDEDGEKV